MNNYLVFDIGGTFIKYALMNEVADIIEKSKVSTPNYKENSQMEFWETMDTIVNQYRKSIVGISISMPGMLNSESGYCKTAGMVTYLNETPITEIFEKRYGIPTVVENDGKCAALAEYWKGNLQECRNGAVVILGTGIGGGLIIDGKLYKGQRFTAGEYSYILTEEKQKYELDGYWGFSCGAEGLAKLVVDRTGEDLTKLDGVRIFERANEGEQAVLDALKDYTDRLAIQIYNLNIMLDLDVIAIGGGISQQPLLLEYLEKSIEQLVKYHPIQQLSPYIPTPNITTCRFYNDANLIGALYHFLQRQEGC